MQSLRRQINRGNACMCFNRFTNEVYVSKKKGSPSFKNLNGEMVVTKNSKNNVIIMSMEEYKKNLMKEKIERNLLKAEEDTQLKTKK